MPDGLTRALTVAKWVAGAIGALAASVTGYGVLGGPVPATRQWVESRFEQERYAEDLRADISLAEGLLSKTDDPELTEALEAQLVVLRARLAEAG